jgi:hypothetical protein
MKRLQMHETLRWENKKETGNVETLDVNGKLILNICIQQKM